MRTLLVGLALTALLSCGDKSPQNATDCQKPPLLQPEQLELPSSFFVPELRHDLVLQFASSRVAEQTGDEWNRRATNGDMRLLRLLTGTTQILAGPYVLIEYPSSRALNQEVCAFLEAVDLDEEAVVVNMIDVDQA